VRLLACDCVDALRSDDDDDDDDESLPVVVLQQSMAHHTTASLVRHSRLVAVRSCTTATACVCVRASTSDVCARSVGWRCVSVAVERV